MDKNEINGSKPVTNTDNIEPVNISIISHKIVCFLASMSSSLTGTHIIVISVLMFPWHVIL